MHVLADSRPLQWPEAWPRIKPQARLRSGFNNVTPPVIREHVVRQLATLGADSVRITCSQPIGFQGIWTMSDPDPGVSIYFELRGTELVVASDAYGVAIDNLRALGLGLETLAMLRHVGAAQIFLTCMNALSSAPLAVPGPTGPDPDARPWWETLGFDKIPTQESAEKAHRVLIRENHPDRPGGNEERAKAITIAMAAARSYYNDPPPTP